VFGGRLVESNGEMELSEQSAALSPVSSTMTGDAYSVYVLSMENAPVYRIGDAVILNPIQPAAPGDDALFRRQDDDGNLGNALLRHLVDIDDSHWHVMQYNPVKKDKLAREDWPIAHRVDAVKRR
jgi:phage repressor protein C with HTH and peptisase S24 domain